MWAGARYYGGAMQHPTGANRPKPYTLGLYSIKLHTCRTWSVGCVGVASRDRGRGKVVGCVGGVEMTGNAAGSDVIRGR